MVSNALASVERASSAGILHFRFQSHSSPPRLSFSLKLKSHHDDSAWLCDLSARPHRYCECETGSDSSTFAQFEQFGSGIRPSIEKRHRSAFAHQQKEKGDGRDKRRTDGKWVCKECVLLGDVRSSAFSNRFCAFDRPQIPPTNSDLHCLHSI